MSKYYESWNFYNDFKDVRLQVKKCVCVWLHAHICMYKYKKHEVQFKNP